MSASFHTSFSSLNPITLDGIARIIVLTNGWIGIAACLLTVQSYIILGQEIHWGAAFFVGAGTIAAYTFLRILRIRMLVDKKDEKGTWMSGNLRFMQFLMLISGLIAAGLFLLLPDTNTMLVAACSAGTTLLYGLFLRRIPGFKILVIAAVWTAGTVILPSMADGIISNNEWTLAMAQACFIFGITIPFDIRDLLVDPPSQKTLPQIFGTFTAKAIAATLICTGLLGYLSMFDLQMIDRNILIALCGSALLALGLTVAARKEFDELYYTGLIDGCMVLQGVLVVLASS